MYYFGNWCNCFLVFGGGIVMFLFVAWRRVFGEYCYGANDRSFCSYFVFCFGSILFFSFFGVGRLSLDGVGVVRYGMRLLCVVIVV